VETLTVLEAFEAMRSFVAQFAGREPADSRAAFQQLLVWTEIEKDGITSDPAQWHDWLRSVADARSRLVVGEALDIP
jgi:hypothetical protein